MDSTLFMSTDNKDNFQDRLISSPFDVRPTQKILGYI
jgi:hypothetical protein